VEKNDGIHSENIPGKGIKVKNRNILVFIFFLFLSSALWYLDSLGNVTSADIRYPVTFTHVPKNKVLSAELPSRLILSLKGTGYSILRTKANASKTPLEIDLSKSGYKHATGNNTSELYIVSSRLIPGIASSLKSDCEIASVKPDTLYFSFK
jgi:hypothetical protein